MKTRLVACTLSLALAASVAASSAVAQIRVSRQADRCLTAQAMGPGLSATGDLSGAENDSNERIDATGYAWQGRDHFFSIVLRGGQTVTISLVEQGGWDGGLYVFRSCAGINATTVGGLDTTATTPLRFTAPTTGRYLIAVDASRRNTGAGYVLTISR